MATISKKVSKKTGRISFRVKVRTQGNYVCKTFTRHTDAKRWEQDTEAAIRNGNYAKEAKLQKHTVSDAINRYQKEYLPRNPKRQQDIIQKLTWFEQEMGHLQLADLSKSIIVEKRLKLKNTPQKCGKPLTNSTVNRYMSAFSHVFTVARNEWEWLDEHPLSRISKLPEPRGRTRYLDEDERKRLLDACQRSKCSQLFLVVTLALSTGARQGEIMSLQWKDVDFERRIITLHHTKNGERRTLPITNHTFALLKAHHEAKSAYSDYVFPSPRADRPVIMRAAWERALELAELNDFHFHDLRHTAASYLAMNGATPAEIAEVLGHKTLAMVKRYAHLSESHVASVVEKMNSKVFG